jgi:hypothetical protein
MMFFMDSTDNAVVAGLDREIAQLEHEAGELQKMVQRLSAVTANLDAFRKVRAVVAAKMQATTDGAVQYSNGNGNQELFTPPAEKPPEVGTKPTLRTPRQGSIGSLAIEALHRAGKPLHVNELLPSIQAQGKPALTQNTLVSTLCGYVDSGRLKRVSPSVYMLP